MKRFYQHSRQTYARGAMLTPGNGVVDDVMYGDGRGAEAGVEMVVLQGRKCLRVVAWSDTAHFAADTAFLLTRLEEAELNQVDPLSSVCDTLMELGYRDASHIGGMDRAVLETKESFLWKIEKANTKEELQLALSKALERVKEWH